MTIEWPGSFRILAGEPELRNFAKGGGPTGTGQEQRVFHDAGLWEVPVTLFIKGREALLDYRNVKARLRQGEDILVKICDKYKPDGAADEGSSAEIAGATALRATEASIAVDGIALRAGHRFRVFRYLYEITKIVSGPSAPGPSLGPWERSSPWNDESIWADTAGSTATYVVEFLPPSRIAFADGDPVIFDDLSVRCVLKNLSEGDLDQSGGRTASPQLTFIEFVD